MKCDRLYIILPVLKDNIKLYVESNIDIDLLWDTIILSTQKDESIVLSYSRY